MIEEMKTFIEVVKCKNFTKAAKKVNLSQPSVSVHIKRLEEYLDARLIDRSSKSKNVDITQSGYIVYEQSKKIMSLLKETKQKIEELESTNGGKLVIGASMTIGDYLLPKILSDFKRENPNIEIEVIINNTMVICDKLNKMEIDIGLVEGIDTHFNFKRRDFYNDQLMIAVSKDSELLNSEFSIDKLQNQTWVSREEGSGTQEFLKIFFMQYNINPKNILVLGSNYSVKEVVKNNIGITLISEKVIEDSLYHGDIKILPTKKNYIRKFSYILSPSKENTKCLDLFLKVLDSYYQN